MMNVPVSVLTPSLDHLPGADLVREGLADLAAGRETVPGLLVEIAAPRIDRMGVVIPAIALHPLDAEIRLYELLVREHQAEAYSQYNALLRRLSSFCRALEGQTLRVSRGGTVR